MDTLGALALATEPPNDELMKRAPVGRTGKFISNTMWRNILGQSFYQFIVMWYLQTQGKELFRLEGSAADLTLNTIIFNSFVFCQVSFVLLRFLFSIALLYSSAYSVFAINHLNKGYCYFCAMQVFNEISSREMEKIDVFKGMLQNYVFVGVLTSTVIFQVVIVQFLGDFANTVPLSGSEWFVSIFFGFLGMPIAAAVKLIPVGAS